MEGDHTGATQGARLEALAYKGLGDIVPPHSRADSTTPSTCFALCDFNGCCKEFNFISAAQLAAFAFLLRLPGGRVNLATTTLLASSLSSPRCQSTIMASVSALAAHDGDPALCGPRTRVGKRKTRDQANVRKASPRMVTTWRNRAEREWWRSRLLTDLEMMPETALPACGGAPRRTRC